MDNTSKEHRSWNMSRIKSKDTTPEKIVRSLLHKMGYRFRLHRKDLPGKPDIVLPKYKTVIFVHGCFWHHHDGCSHAYIPKSNTHFWINKFKKNKERDKDHIIKLNALGWKVIVLWECELSNIENITQRLDLLLSALQ